ncbi:hypothetical protein LPUS_07610 [Lasallia pustulata]|uniref:Glycoprotease family protein n=1 Tax=Lasallia pustulata TaxID=136370 RepID=A0A1W5D3N6_9LECA|nr:hypothetical protein LPUS_07610 [Lasallia pustulata]
MATTHKRTNATPPHVQLPSYNIPRMPFSSPIDEEILSPISPDPARAENSPAGSVPSDQPTRAIQNEHSGDGSRQRRPSIQKSSSEGWDGKQGNNKASKLPALNVVTNFPRPPIHAQRAGVEDAAEAKRQVYGTNKGKADNSVKDVVGLVDRQTSHGTTARDRGDRNRRDIPGRAGSRRSQRSIAGLEDRLRAQPSHYAAALGLRAFDKSLHKRQLSEKERKNPYYHLSPAGSKNAEMSPDGSIAIGISVPSDRLAEFAISPETATVERKSVDVPPYTKSRDPPQTPNIVITPAKDEALWFATSDEEHRPARRRPTSSVYSQATFSGGGVSILADAPPVPTSFPEAYSKYDKEGKPKESTSFAKKSDRAQPEVRDSATSDSRVVSAYTVFDEEDSPQTVDRERPYSGESYLRMLDRTSMDTIATRHHSQGWWNTVLSPFLSRHNTIMARNNPNEELAISELPSRSQAAKAEHFWLRDEESSSIDSSPLTPATGAARSGHTSIWTEMSRWEAERGSISRAPDHAVNGSGSLKGVSNAHTGTVNVDPVPAVDDPARGLAAEYLEACRHDRDSPTPYLECQNHVCRPRDGAVADRQKRSVDARAMHGLSRPVADDAPRAGEGPVKDSFFQVPSNRFSAAFAQATKTRPRANSESTEIDEDSTDPTPAVQEARVAPVVRARLPVLAVQYTPPGSRDGPTAENFASPQTSIRGPPPYSPPRRAKPTKRYVAVMPTDFPGTISDQSRPNSPTASSQQRAMTSHNISPAAEAPKESAWHPTQNTYIANHYYERPDAYTRSTSNAPVTLADLEPPPNVQHRAETKRETKEKSEKRNSRKGESKIGKGCLYCVKRCFATKKRRRNCGIAAGFLAMIIVVLALAMTLTRKHKSMPVQSQWLNVTGYPPIPTGIATIAQPDAVDEDSRCVQPATMWSCALPKEQQASISPNEPDQPNFRVQIFFSNATASKTTANATVNKRETRVFNAVTAGSFIRRRILAFRDVLLDYTPSPSPPSQNDQIFLGNTTDNNAAPFNGEATPFYITFLPTTTVSSVSQVLRRQAQSGTSTADPFPDIASAIPAPSVNPNGTAASATLLPLPSSQPLRLYNRGSSTEHYGFYNYFDRSIFLKNSTDANDAGVPSDQNGESTESEATARCTWAQTRFLVQIWTNKGTSASLLPSSNSTAPATPTPTSPSSSSRASPNATTPSANDFSRPGSFPYPVSITLDRHGGDVESKMIYCYGMDDREAIVASEKSLHLEDRGFGGELVNAADGPFGNVTVTGDGGTAGWQGGIDGGSGGCSCRWQNWEGGS